MAARRGVTRVEVLLVLVVLVVVGSQAAILWRKQYLRKKATVTQCAGNLAQIGLAIQQYTSEHYYNDTMKAAPGPRHTPQQLINDFNLLWDDGNGLISGINIFRCPLIMPWRLTKGEAPKPLSAVAGSRSLGYSLTANFEKNDPSMKVIVADNPAAMGAEFSSQHNPNADSVTSSHQSYTDNSGWFRACETANPDEDADPTGIYTDDPAVVGETDTLIPFLDQSAQTVNPE